MAKEINKDDVFSISDNVVSREIEGEIIIVPLISGIGDNDDELFSTTETGKAVWTMLDGKVSVAGIITALSREYSFEGDELEQDVIGFLGAVYEKTMVEKVN